MITGIGNKAGTRDPGPGTRETPTVATNPSHALCARGFTLIEMLAVIVLIAIGVTLAAVSLRGTGRANLDATAQRVAAALRETRTRAMATRTPQSFIVDLHRRSFDAPGRDARPFPRGAVVDVTSAAEESDHRGLARIRFFPDGSSSGGNIALRRRQRDVRVDVDWLTGAVTVAEGATK